MQQSITSEMRVGSQVSHFSRGSFGVSSPSHTSDCTCTQYTYTALANWPHPVQLRETIKRYEPYKQHNNSRWKSIWIKKLISVSNENQFKT